VRKIDRDDPLEPPSGVLKGVRRDGIDGSVIPGRRGRDPSGAVRAGLQHGGTETPSGTIGYTD